jgi:hypothetical protein
MQPESTAAARDAIREAWVPGRELRQSLFLIAFLLASVGVYLGLGILAVRVLA